MAREKVMKLNAKVPLVEEVIKEMRYTAGSFSG